MYLISGPEQYPGIHPRDGYFDGWYMDDDLVLHLNSIDWRTGLFAGGFLNMCEARDVVAMGAAALFCPSKEDNINPDLHILQIGAIRVLSVS